MKFRLLILFLVALQLSFGQTYEVVEVQLEANVISLSGINSKYSDFSPFVFDSKLYFTSMREYDLYNLGENNWKNTGFLNVFEAELKGDITPEVKIKTAGLYSEKLMSNSHTGPICFSVTGDTLFYTQVIVDPKKNKKENARPKIYMKLKEGNGWSEGTLLPFNNDKFSYGHPYYHSATRTLYFASNQKGGKGGKDIFKVTASKGNWGKVEALNEINTKHDEMYPFFQDDIIFFSSNKPGGKGGLDVYWKFMSQVGEAQILEGMNSEFDDFGLYIFPDMAKGFMSSNRIQKNKDDIYFFFLKKNTIIKHELAGRFMFRNLDGEASNLQVKITGEDGFELITTTDENGNFIFKNLESGGQYKIQPITEEEMSLVIYDKNGNVMATLLTDENGQFTYKLLDPGGVGTLSLMPEDMMDFTLNQGHLSGQFVYEDEPGKYPQGMPVILTDEEGNVKFTANTDKYGNFDFNQLSLDENYLLTTKEGMEEGMVLLIYDKKGNVTAQLKPNESGQFVYRKLDPGTYSSLTMMESEDEAFDFQTKTVSGYFEYKNLNGSLGEGLNVYAYSEDGFLLAETKTNENGEFRFRSLPVQDNILFKIDESDERFQLDDFTLYIFDRHGKKIAVLKRGQNGFFIYKPLGFEGSSLSTVENGGDDFNLNINSKYDIVKVYFDSNEKEVKSNDRSKLDAIVKMLKEDIGLKVEINAYADARASDEYNLILSQKRGEWIVSYLKRKGISSNRIIVNAYGESQLVDEENHDLNRRAEIRIY